MTSQLFDEVARGEGIPLSEVCRIIPSRRKDKKPIGLHTVTRWAIKGVLPLGDASDRIRLEAVRTPAGWLTSRAAVARFLKAQTPDLSGPEPTPVAPAARQATARHASAVRAQKRLKLLGV